MENLNQQKNPLEKLRKINEKRYSKALKRKFAPKPWANENKWAYNVSLAAILIGMLINVATGFAFLKPFLSGIFGTGANGMIITGGLALLILVLIEYAAWVNADRFWSAWFSGQETRTGNAITQVALIILTVFMAYKGAPEFARFLHPEPGETLATLKDEGEIKSRYLPQIQASERERDIFFNARSWKGKLDIKDGAEYKRLQGQVVLLRNKMNDAIEQVRADNKEAETLTANINRAADAEWKAQKDDTGQKLALFSVIVAIMTQFFLNRKERYDYLSYLEMVESPTLSNKISSNGNGNGHFKEFQGMGKQ